MLIQNFQNRLRRLELNTGVSGERSLVLGCHSKSDGGHEKKSYLSARLTSLQLKRFKHSKIKFEIVIKTKKNSEHLEVSSFLVVVVVP